MLRPFQGRSTALDCPRSFSADENSCGVRLDLVQHGAQCIIKQNDRLATAMAFPRRKRDCMFSDVRLDDKRSRLFEPKAVWAAGPIACGISGETGSALIAFERRLRDVAARQPAPGKLGSGF